MNIFEKIAEQRIREAMENGEFDNLSLKGKPLNLDDYFSVPEDYRMAFHILKNANILPQEVELKKEIENLQKLINACNDEEQYKKLKKEINEKILHYNILMEKYFHKSNY
jgi:formylmethanofuran dehydrogenase subunit A